jgi:uncharacterized protein with PIN domain
VRDHIERAMTDSAMTDSAVTDPVPRLLADRMLLGLARYLRAAGYDTGEARDGDHDRDLIARARAEQRRILSRDRRLLEFRDGPRLALILESDGLLATAREVTQRLTIDWLRAPFTRCLLCNVPVEAADPDTSWPPRIERSERLMPLTRCPDCGRLYWQGGHTARMRARLARWAAGDFS